MNICDFVYFRLLFVSSRGLFFYPFLAPMAPPAAPWGPLGAPRGPLEVPGVTLEVSGGSFWEAWGSLWVLWGALLGPFGPPDRSKRQKVVFQETHKTRGFSLILLSGAPLGLSLGPLDAP